MKSDSQKDSYSSTFISALFTIAKIRKPVSPPLEEWIRKTWYDQYLHSESLSFTT
jgi:hypothetical protein